MIERNAIGYGREQILTELLGSLQKAFLSCYACDLVCQWSIGLLDLSRFQVGARHWDIPSLDTQSTMKTWQGYSNR